MRAFSSKDGSRLPLNSCDVLLGRGVRMNILDLNNCPGALSGEAFLDFSDLFGTARSDKAKEVPVLGSGVSDCNATERR